MYRRQKNVIWTVLLSCLSLFLFTKTAYADDNTSSGTMTCIYILISCSIIVAVALIAYFVNKAIKNNFNKLN